MAKAIAAFFPTRGEGESARDALIEQGFNPDQISFLTSDPTAHDTTAVGPKVSTGAESQAGRDAFIGSAIGLAAGVVAFAIPGLGALIAAGPIAGAVGGLSVGAAAGGLIGLLKDHGIPEEEAAFYEEGIRRGGSLVTVRGVTDDEASLARDIFDRNGAAEIEKLADEWHPAPHV